MERIEIPLFFSVVFANLTKIGYYQIKYYGKKEKAGNLKN